MATIEAASISAKRLIAFPPDAERGAILYASVKDGLANTFQQLFDASRSVANIDEARFAHFLDQLRHARRVSPRLFAMYFDILDAISRDDIEAVSNYFAMLTTSGAGSESQEVVCQNLTDEHLGSGNAARYKRWAEADDENPLHLNALTAEEFARVSTLGQKAFELLDAAAPEVSGEIRSLLVEVIFAKGDASEKFTFHGISSFCLWGAIVMNAEGHKTELEILQTLAHEGSHMHLFGVALDSPLVLNDDDQRYKSPLRLDPRPMDGIYHATYVSARMHYALARLLNSGALSYAQTDEARTACINHVKSFTEGLATVEAEGELTELGQHLMAEAKAYMFPYVLK